MLTTSVNCSPLMVVPPAKGIENVFERSCAVELAPVLYALCPEQLDPHFDEGKIISLLPVSKSTVSCQGSDSGFSYHVSGHTSEGHGRCANRDGTIPQLFVAIVGQRVAAAATPGKFDTPGTRMCYAGIPLVRDKSSLNFPVNDRWATRAICETRERAYATERLMPPSNSEVSTTPLKGLPRLAIGTAIPREAGDPASATAAVRKGSGARTRISEKYISSWTLLCLIGAR